MHDPIVFQPPDERWARVTCVTCIQVRSFTFSFALGVGQPFVCWKKLKNFTGGNFCQKNCKRRLELCRNLDAKNFEHQSQGLCKFFFCEMNLFIVESLFFERFRLDLQVIAAFCLKKIFLPQNFFLPQFSVFLELWSVFTLNTWEETVNFLNDSVQLKP